MKKAFEIRFRSDAHVIDIVMAETKKQALGQFVTGYGLVAVRAPYADGLRYDVLGHVDMDDKDNQRVLEANGWWLYEVRENGKYLGTDGWKD